MRPYCYKCELVGIEQQKRSNFVRFGFYFRTSDKKYVRRYRCLLCKCTFSKAYFDPHYRQKRRDLNRRIEEDLASTCSLRRLARKLKVNRKTVVRKFRLMADLAEASFHEANGRCAPSSVIEFDDLETAEHTKCKPLSVSIAVEQGTRRILGIEVSRMPASGMLVKRAKKYGRRIDERSNGRRRLFAKIQNLVDPFVEIKSDQNPHYPLDVKEYFPLARHYRYLGKRGSLGGQVELKKTKWDPLFSINHTCAKMRADVNRLIRKTWCTTKNPAELQRHLMLFANYHNKNLPPAFSTG